MQNASSAPAAGRSLATDGQRLATEITELCCYMSAAEARLLSLIREFDAKEYWAEAGHCSCAHWLNFKCGIGMNAAREKIRVAHALAGLPKVSAAFAKGLLSYSKVRAITRVASADNEDYLMMIAKHGTAHHVEKLVARYRSALRIQDADVAAEQYRQRELSHYYDSDGCLVIKARIPAEQGAIIVKALEMTMDDQRPAGAVEEVPDMATPIAARRADALAEVAEAYLNNAGHGGSRADRYQVVVHVTAETSEIADGPGIAMETSRRIACDSAIVGLREGAGGEALSIGRRSRTIPQPMRRALLARDGGCRFPGCTNTRFVDGHHIEHWADGGDTSLGNLVLLCRHHHHLVHEGGYVCEKDAHGNVTFRNRHGRPLEDDPPALSPGIAAEIIDRVDRAIFDMEVDRDGCTAKWNAGERMDWQHAVAAMF